jgi:hypothetical protein
MTFPIFRAPKAGINCHFIALSTLALPSTGNGCKSLRTSVEQKHAWSGCFLVETLATVEAK